MPVYALSAIAKMCGFSSPIRLLEYLSFWCVFKSLKSLYGFMVRFKNKPNLKPVLLSDYLTKGGMLWVQYQPISGNHIKHVRSGFHLRS